jgi:hypothetical protein
VSADFPALQHVLARSYAARAVRFCSGAVRTAWAHSTAARQVARGHAALGALPAGARLRFWSITIVWMGIGMMLSGLLIPRYSAPVWPVGQGLAIALLGAMLAAGSTPLAEAWPRSGLRRWLRAESAN